MDETASPIAGEILRALANEARLDILRWLKDPAANFGHQAVGDFTVEGVCVSVIQERSGLSQPTISAHLKILHQAGLITRTKVGPWHYYKRDEDAIRTFLNSLSGQL